LIVSTVTGEKSARRYENILHADPKFLEKYWQTWSPNPSRKARFTTL